MYVRGGCRDGSAAGKALVAKFDTRTWNKEEYNLLESHPLTSTHGPWHVELINL